ncbi:MAG TPA: hypothetical protein VIH96_06145 [Paraburkholderia sp.]|jgi:hypothetical protein
MKDIITGSHEASAEGSATSAVPRSGADRASHSVAPHAPSNWAWATPTSQYDWMDSHAPFATLD